MASVVAQLFAFGDGASLSFTYDDVTGAVTSVTWANPANATFVITFTEGAHTFTRSLTPSTSGSVNLPNNRFSMSQRLSANGLMEWVNNFSANMGG